jgi:hypothetical protein
MPNYNKIWPASLTEVKGIRRHIHTHGGEPMYPKFAQPVRAKKKSKEDKKSIAKANPGIGTDEQQHDANPNSQHTKFRMMAEKEYPIRPVASDVPLSHVMVALNIDDDDQAGSRATDWIYCVAFLSMKNLRSRTMLELCEKGHVSAKVVRRICQTHSHIQRVSPPS